MLDIQEMCHYYQDTLVLLRNVFERTRLYQNQIGHYYHIWETGVFLLPYLAGVPKEGIEPSFLTEHDFESCASAYSATSAGLLLIIPESKCQIY
jgi:hypothetical protein